MVKHLGGNVYEYQENGETVQASIKPEMLEAFKAKQSGTKFKEGQVIKGNDGKERIVTSCYINDFNGKQIYNYRTLKNGKPFGPVQGCSDSKLPKWL